MSVTFRLELSNNLAENSMRPVALGRRNWIHIGSEEAGPRVAAIVSIVETCRRLKIPIRDYLCSILPGLADIPIKRIAEFTPLCLGGSKLTDGIRRWNHRAVDKTDTNDKGLKCSLRPDLRRAF
jgi:hypothetical protein